MFHRDYLGPKPVFPGCSWWLLVLWIGSAQRLSQSGRWKGMSPRFGTRKIKGSAGCPLSPFLSMWCYVRITYAECSLPSVRSLPNKPCELLPASKDFFSSVCSTVTCNHVVLLTCTNPLQGVGFPLPPRCTASIQRTSPWARPARHCRWCSATHPSDRDRGGGG